MQRWILTIVLLVSWTAVAGESDKFQSFLDKEWRYTMEQYPSYATYLGYPGYNDRWTDMSPAAIARRKAHNKNTLAELKRIKRAQLNKADQVNYDLYLAELEQNIAGDQFPDELQPLNQMGGVQQDVARTLARMPQKSVADYNNIIARLEKTPQLIEQNIALLKLGLGQKITPPQVTLRDVPDQVQAQMQADLSQNPLLKAFQSMPNSIPEAEQKALRAKAEMLVKNQIIPAYKQLHDYLKDVYIPGARSSIALSQLPNGQQWYDYRARRATTTNLSAKEIHDIGQREVKRIRQEMDKIIATTPFKGDFAGFVNYLRTDPQFYFTRWEDLIAQYQVIAKKADAELIRFFKKLPSLPYGIKPVPKDAEKSQTTAYYEGGSIQAGRPGIFYANTYDLNSRPKWEMEALTLHEAMPGHHLQIALAQEMPNMPEFRKNADYTAFIEGWGLYSESLGEDMGFYQDKYAKFGQLTYEMWRAIRLVVDTGMHALGWSREQAIDFFTGNTGKAKHDVVVEVDRYIVWPGQALAYKIGELKIKELRSKAQKELGKAYDIREFHAAVLENGAIPLALLEKNVLAWIDSQKKSVGVN